MKKKFLLVLLFFIGIHTIYATNSFFIDTTKLSFVQKEEERDLLSSIDDKYRLSYQMYNDKNEIAEKITEISRNITYLLLRRKDSGEESALEYYERYQKYLTFKYSPVIPKDPNTFNGLDVNSEEYTDDLISSFNVPNMFHYLDELGIEYDTISSIRVVENKGIYMAEVSLPNVKMRQVNPKNPKEYQTITTDLVLYYLFKEWEGEYKLYYLKGETIDSLSTYFNELENKERAKVMTIMSPYTDGFENLYDYKQLESVTSLEKENIINKNKDSIVLMNSYYNNNLLASAHGFFLKEGILVTSWSYMEKSLNEAQYLIIKDGNGNFYDLDGIVTINDNADIVVLKLKQEVGVPVTISEVELETGSPIFTISSKSGIGYVLQSGIHIVKSGYEHNILPLLESDAGSPLMDSDGNVVGMNTSTSTNTSISNSIPKEALTEILEKIDGVNFSSIPFISFNDMKEKYYYINYKEEKIKTEIPTKVWNTYSKIGDIENTISLKLVKASYQNGIMSLRYKNDASNYIDNLQFSNSFRKELEDSGYQEISKSEDRYVYQNEDYRVIIMSQFHYLIIVMVNL